MSALADAAPLLCCPRCTAVIEVTGGALCCEQGHSYDIARQGYVNLLSKPAGAAADDAAMVSARAHVLVSGVYSPILEALIEVVTGLSLPPGAVVDIGAGTGYYTAGVLDALVDRPGVAVDLSAYAARRCARAHPRLAALVGDAWAGIPVRVNAAALVMDVFAPRNADEFERVLAPGGAVVVVTPAPEHLTELVTSLGLPRVDPRKAERLADTFARFSPGPTRQVRRALSVEGRIAALLAGMGPGAHHADPADLEALARDASVEVTLAVDVSVFTTPPSDEDGAA